MIQCRHNYKSSRKRYQFTTLYYFLIYRNAPLVRTGITALRSPDGWQKLESINSSEGQARLLFEGQGTLDQAANGFADEMTKTGWRQKSEDLLDSFAVQVYEKDDCQAAVYLYNSGEDKAKALVIAAETAKELDKELTVPGKDVDGSDIEGLPRFPGSFRSRCESFPDEQIVEYQVLSDTSLVSDFYISSVVENDWTIERVEKTGDAIEIVVLKPGQGLATKTITAIQSQQNLITIAIIYTEF